MALTGKMVRQVDIKSGGDVFHELFRYHPHQISAITPANVKACNLHQGEWGKVGSIIIWNYTIDGKELSCKEVIEAIDEGKKLVKFKVIEGDLLKPYKNFSITVHVDTIGANNLVTWTSEYEKRNANVGDPTAEMDFCEAMTKDIETHHLK